VPVEEPSTASQADIVIGYYVLALRRALDICSVHAGL
jgi:hypothetical protein